MTKEMARFIPAQLAAAPTWNELTIHAPISEDLVRQSLIDAIELCKQAYKGQWFELTQAAQYIHIHIEARLNAELKALLVGDIDFYSRRPR